MQFALGFVAYGSSLLPGCLTTTSVLFKQRAYPIHATLGVTATVAACASVLSGIDHENTLLGCAYSVSTVCPQFGCRKTNKTAKRKEKHA